MSKFDYENAERGPWQPAGSKPPVPGVYEIDAAEMTRDRDLCFSYFDGSEWGVGAWASMNSFSIQSAIERAKTYAGNISDWIDGCRWRGLKHKPEGF